MTVKLSKEQKKMAVLNSKDIAAVMQRVLKRENKMGRAQEHFWVVGLDSANKILFIELIALGQQNRVATPPPDVFRMAIYKLAVSAILVHNHPSGNLKPSKADVNFTDHMLKSGEFLRINVLDHLIITETDYLSFGDAGIMLELKLRDTWRFPGKKESEEEEKLKEDIEKETMKTNILTLAKNFKDAGVSMEKIKQATGLSLAVIKKL